MKNHLSLKKTKLAILINALSIFSLGITTIANASDIVVEENNEVLTGNYGYLVNATDNLSIKGSADERIVLKDSRNGSALLGFITGKGGSITIENTDLLFMGVKVYTAAMVNIESSTNVKLNNISIGTADYKARRALQLDKGSDATLINSTINTEKQINPVHVKGGSTLTASNVIFNHNHFLGETIAASDSNSHLELNMITINATGNAGGIVTKLGATVNINNSEINVTDVVDTTKPRMALNLQSDGLTSLTNTKINALGTTSIGILVNNVNGNVTLDNSHVIGDYAGVYQVKNSPHTILNLKNGAILESQNNAVSAQGKLELIMGDSSEIRGDILTTDTGNLTLTVQNNSRIIGNVLTSDGGISNITLNNSFLDGSTKLEDSTSNVLALNLNNNSQWNITDNSNVTNLSFDGTGIATFISDDYSTLTIENLSGNGIFHINTDVLTGSDLIQVTGTSSGTHLLQINDKSNGSVVTAGTEQVKMIETVDGTAEFNLLHDSNIVDIGGWQYELVRGDALSRNVFNHWYLQGNGKKSGAADNSSNFLNINYLLSNVENQTLLQRLGELRYTADRQGDAWVRGYTGKLSSFEDSSLRGFDMSYNGLQIGFDKSINNNMYMGIMMGTAKADIDYDIGTGTAASYHLGLYSTFQSENGWYTDLITKYTNTKNIFNNQTSGGNSVDGRSNSHGYSVAIEAGKRFYLTNTNQGWYLEPQTQFTYSHQNSTTANSSNGLTVQLDAFDSMLARASTLVGYQVTQGNNPINVYLKTGYVKEFDGKTGYALNNANHANYKFNGDWWDNGIGVNAQLNTKHNIYLEGDYAIGNKFNKKQINLGYRYNF